MRTLCFIVAGIVAFAIVNLIARRVADHGSPVSTALKIFLPVWFVVAAINLTIGVRSAGYTVMEEAPIFLVIFGIPAVVALLTWWRTARR